MNVLFATSECAPFIKTGGLGDVAGALPLSLAKKNVNVSVIMPYYKTIKEKYSDKVEFVTSFDMSLSWRNLYCGILKYESGGVKYYFIDNEYYFNRPNIYGDYDDGEKFAYFSKAILASLNCIDDFPEVIHLNDWQTALVPVMKKAYYQDDESYSNIKTIFTIHNIEYQGKTELSFLNEVLGMSDTYMQYLNYGGCINFMYSAIMLADKVTTVSKTYAEEIKEPYFAHGLSEVLRQNWYKLRGVLNGIDTTIFDPVNDKNLYFNFSDDKLAGKYKNKAKLQQELGLDVDDTVPVLSMITRLVSHKGIDLVKFVMEEVLNKINIQLVILGTGSEEYENYFKYLQDKYPGRVSSNIKFDSALANKIYASSDMFLMPSQSEPCGLAQMISMRYGTLVIAREVGGLKDTVYPVDVSTSTIEGRGFTFKSYNASDMADAIYRACELYNQQEYWNILMRRVMKEDFSWDNSADEYINLYNL